MKNPARAVIFDIDGTLTPQMSWLELTRRLGASVERHEAIFAAYLARTITYEASRQQLLGVWQATGQATRTQMEAMFQAWPLDPAAAPLIKQLQTQGLIVALISGSFDVFVHIIAHRLGVKQWYANTQLVFDDTGRLVNYHYVRDQAGQKLKHLRAFCDDQGFEITDCVAVGDGPNDLELFRATNRGIMVDSQSSRPELAELRAAAWQQVTALKEAERFLVPTNGPASR